MRIRRPRLKMFRTPTFRYIFIHSLIFISLFGGVAAFNNWLDNPRSLFWSISIPLFFLGILHTWLIYAAHENWPKLIEGWGTKEGGFTLFINLVGVITLYFLIQKKGVAISPYASNTLWSGFIFILPFLWHRAFFAHLSIPEKEYPPLIIETLEDIRGKIVIEPNDKGIIWVIDQGKKEKRIRMWMPLKSSKLTIKQIFKAFILYHNSENDGDLIEIREDDKPVKWQLYHQPIKFLSKKILDPSVSIQSNKMRFSNFKGKNNLGHAINIRTIEIFVYSIKETPVEEPKKKN